MQCNDRHAYRELRPASALPWSLNLSGATASSVVIPVAPEPKVIAPVWQWPGPAPPAAE